MAKIRLPQTSSEIGYNNSSFDVPNLINSTQYIGAALQGLGDTLSDYATKSDNLKRFKEKEDARADAQILSGENYKGQLESIMNTYFNPAVYVDGVFDAGATVERSADIIEDFPALVMEAAGEAESLALGLGLKSPEVLNHTLSEAANQFKNMINNQEEILGKIRHIGESASVTGMQDQLRSGHEVLLSGEGSEDLREALLEAQSITPTITDNELKLTLQTEIQNKEIEWLKSYPDSFEGEGEFLLDYQNGVFDEFPRIKTKAKDKYTKTRDGFGKIFLTATVSSNQKSGTSGISGSPGSLRLNEVTEEEINLLREVADNEEKGSRAKRVILNRILLIQTADNRNKQLDTLVGMLDSAPNKLAIATATQAIANKYTFGPQETEALDNILNVTGMYRNLDDEQIGRIWTVFNNLTGEMPTVFKKQLEGWLQQSGARGHTDGGWDTVARIGKALVHNNYGIDSALEIKTRNFAAAYRAGTGNYEHYWKVASDKLTYATDEKPGGLGYPGTIDTILSGESYIPSQWFKFGIGASASGDGGTLGEVTRKYLTDFMNDKQIFEALGASSADLRIVGIPGAGADTVSISRELSHADRAMINQSMMNLVAVNSNMLTKTMVEHLSPQEITTEALKISHNQLLSSLVVDESGDKTKLWRLRTTHIQGDITDSNGNKVSLRSQLGNLIKDTLVGANPKGKWSGNKQGYVDFVYNNSRLIYDSELGAYKLKIEREDESGGFVTTIDEQGREKHLFVNVNDAVTWAANTDNLVFPEDIKKIYSEGTLVSSPVLGFNPKDVLTEKFQSSTPSNQVDALEDFLRWSDTDSESPFNKDAISEILEIPAYESMDDNSKLELLKKAASSYRDLINQDPFISNPVTRPYYEKHAGLLAEELMAKEAISRANVMNLGPNDPNLGYIETAGKLQQIEGLWDAKTHIPIALARAKEDFLAREVNLKPQEQLQALYKQMRHSTGRFRASDFLHGNATVSDITQRAIFREVMGVKTKNTNITPKKISNTITKVNQTLGERRNRPNLLNVYRDSQGNPLNTQAPLYELNGGMVTNPKFYSNEGILSRIAEPLDGTSEEPWIELRSIYRNKGYKQISKGGLVRAIGLLASDDVTTDIDYFDYVRAAVAGKFAQYDANLVFAMDDSRFSKFLWEMIGKEDIAVKTVDWTAGD